MFTGRHFLILIFVLFLTIIIIPDISTAKADNSFSSGLTHLLELTTDKSKKFDLNKIEQILSYIDSAEYQTTPEYSGGLKNSPSAYYAYELKSTMGRMLRYCYDSNIPACAVLPEYIRLSSWFIQNKPANNDQPLELWQSLDNFQEPVIIHGSMYLQNTPDINTGAYYGFDSFKSDILFKYKQKNVFISISKQKDISEVGKKGFVLGRYKDLNYFYSGKPGLNRLGLGKIKSYLYDGFSVSVYIEGKDKKTLQCGTFKWLRGGWAGMNMIKTKHIQKGLKRFATLQKKLLESNKFPGYDELLKICKEFSQLPEKKIKKRVGAYFCQLQQNCNCETACPAMLKNGFNLYDYINKMSIEEMRSTLIVDYIKGRLNNIAGLNELKITLNN